MRCRGATGILAVLAASTLLLAAACDDSSESSANRGKTRPLPMVTSKTEFNRIIDAAGERLLVFDLFAEWCAPCKELEPLLEKIAWETRETADFYRINIDKNRDLAELFKVHGIPYVAFVKNQTIVYSLTGLRSKKTYLKAIESYSRGSGAPRNG